MTSFRIGLYRVVGSFWLNRQTGLYARFVESRAYSPVLGSVALSGLLPVILGTMTLMKLGPRAAVWVVLSYGLFLGLMVLLASYGATSLRSSKRASTPEENLARCRELLERAGFRVQSAKGAVLRLRRGMKALAESEWRSFPMEVIVTARQTGSATLLSAQCTVAANPNRFMRKLVAETSKAVAELDSLGLERLDRTLVLRRRTLMMPGLARTIFGALAISVLLTALALTGMTAMVGWRLMEANIEYLKRTDATWFYSQTLRAMEIPARLDLDRLLSLQQQRRTPPASSEAALQGFRSDRLLLAVEMPNGRWELLNPPAGSPLRPLAEGLISAGFAPEAGGVVKVGDRFFTPLTPYDRENRRNLMNNFGLPDSPAGEPRLIIGSLLTLADLAEGAPPHEPGYELTLYRSGRAILDYRWTDKGVEVDEQSEDIPQEIVAAEFRSRGLRLLDVLGGEDLEPTRTVQRRGTESWVTYFGHASASGWSGFTFAEPARSAKGVRAFFGAAFLLGFIGLVLVLLFAMLIAFAVSGRIARPVLQVRSALRRISEGDYSARIESRRTDEIGQLQALTNQTAEELRKRESMKELLGKYLSKQVADRVLESDTRDALAGARREVSVLFADVRGFTSYSEKHDPEDVTQSLNDYFEVMVDVIAAHEGVLDKYIGDGLMVVFGAPMSQPDHATRAVVTALEMQAALQSLNLKRAQHGLEPIAIGIGVNTGLAISGNLGSIKRMEFTVIGDTVNLAARLESRAAQGQILVGKTTYEKVKDQVRAEPIGQVAVRGKAEPVDVWLVSGLVPAKMPRQNAELGLAA